MSIFLSLSFYLFCGFFFWIYSSKLILVKIIVEIAILPMKISHFHNKNLILNKESIVVWVFGQIYFLILIISYFPWNFHPYSLNIRSEIWWWSITLIKFILVINNHIKNINWFLANVPILYTLKTQENQRFSGSFSEYKMRNESWLTKKWLTKHTKLL